MPRSQAQLYASDVCTPAYPSATLVLLRDGSAGLEVLLSQRASKSSFVPGMYVFPGGRADEDDTPWVTHWAQHFPLHWGARTRVQALAALRETFEEMGIALVTGAAGLPLNPSELGQLDRARPFFEQLAQRAWQPALDALVPVAERVTHASSPKRFETGFFYAAMPAAQTAQPDGVEQLDALWLPVHSQPWQGENPLPMIEPTVHSLQALLGFADVATALQAAREIKAIPYSLAREAWADGQLRRIYPQHVAYAELELVAPCGAAAHGLDWPLPSPNPSSPSVQPAHLQTPVALLRHVQRLTAPNPSVMTGPGTNTYLVGNGEQGFVVIDPGPDIASHVQAILAATQGHIHALLCTHSHPDHFPAAFALQKHLALGGQSVPIWGMASLPTAAAHSQFVPDRQLVHGETFTFPVNLAAGAEQLPITLQFVHTPGHAANHVCVLLQEDGLLFSGDHILSGTTTIIAPPDGDMSDFLNSLDVLDRECQRWDAHFILPAHGHVLGGWGDMAPQLRHQQQAGYGARRIIAGLKAHRLAREEKIAQAMRATAWREGDVLDGLLPIAYADTPTALWPLALRSMQAHVLRIVQLQINNAIK